VISVATRDKEAHRKAYVEAVTRLAKAYRLPESERAKHAALFASIVEAAEFHRMWATWTPRAEADRLWGTVTGIAERWAKDGVDLGT